MLLKNVLVGYDMIQIELLHFRYSV